MARASIAKVWPRSVCIEVWAHRVDVPACSVATAAPFHTGGGLGREVMLLLGPCVVVNAVRRVQLSARLVRVRVRVRVRG